MLVTSNRFCHTPLAFSGCRSARIHSTSSGLSCQGSPVRLACSCKSTQLAWLADTGGQGGASDTHTPGFSHTLSAGAERLIRSGATADTASEALDPGERRLFLLADEPGKPTDQHSGEVKI